MESPETRRREAVLAYGLLDTAPEAEYDEICRLAAQLCGMPISALSLADDERIWVKSGLGVGTGSLARDLSICAKVAEAAQPIFVPDASADERFRESPLVTGAPGIRAYGGVPLVAPNGAAVGVLCVADRVPRELDPIQREALEILARQAVARMELRREMAERELDARWLAEQGEMLRTIFELEPECVKVVGLDGTVQRMNPAGLSMLEAEDPFQVVGRNLLDFAAPEHRERIVAAFERVRGGGTAMVEFEAVGLRGGRRSLESHAVPMRETGGAIRSLLIVTRDVTERRRAEAALRRKDEELRQAQKMEAVGRMAGGIAHDFNNILTALVGYGEMLIAETPPWSAARGYTREVLQAAERARRLCSRLLGFSRRQPSRPELLDLGVVIRELEGLLRPLLGAGVSLRMVLPPGLRQVRADRNQLEQVVVNLVVNARDAMPGGGTVEIAAENLESPGVPSPGSSVRMTVRDTGVGMSQEVQSHLFEPFFTTKEPGKGTGLGLSTVYGIVRAAGGAIRASSRPGEGTTIVVEFPAAEGAVAEPPPPTREAPAILVVEASAEVRRLIRQILEPRGCRVVETAGLQEALLALDPHAGNIGVVLADAATCRTGSADLAARLRAVRPGLKLLVLSAHPGPSDPTVGIVPKPFSPDALLRAVKAALGDWPGSVPEARRGRDGSSVGG
jgi:PAS domain S-box-containing protein